MPQNLGGMIGDMPSEKIGSFITKDDLKDSVCPTPRLVKSLMHRRVTKIASGGVHNICIVEPFPNTIATDLHKYLMQSKYTDVVFLVRDDDDDPATNSVNKGFADNSNGGSEDEEEEAKEELIGDSSDEAEDKLLIDQPTPIKQIKIARINAHQFVISARSSFFAKLLVDAKNNDQQQKVVELDASYEAFRRVIDYIYLDDLAVVDSVIETSDLLEIIKLAKLYCLG
jgi:hypothetical protein